MRTKRVAKTQVEVGGGGTGTRAGAQASVATQITCASNNDTSVYITSSLRHDGGDSRQQW